MQLFIDNIIWIDKADSSNNIAVNLTKKKLINPGSVIALKEQTAGRGQKGNKWFSAPGYNLTFSIIINPELNPELQFYISKYTAISCFRFVSKYCNNVKIKWPNDILVNKKKIAGILIENNFQAGKIKQSIIGIGININQQNFNTITNATSFSIENNSKKFDLKKLLNEFIFIFNENLDSFHNFRLIDAVYHKNLYLLNQKHLFKDKNENIFEGIIRKTTTTGMLEVFTNKGVRLFDLKEITPL